MSGTCLVAHARMRVLMFLFSAVSRIYMCVCVCVCVFVCNSKCETSNLIPYFTHSSSCRLERVPVTVSE